MLFRKSLCLLFFLSVVFALTSASYMNSEKSKKNPAAAAGTAVMWQEPTDISSRDLFYGPGGKEHEPQGPFKFIKRFTSGSAPKFVIEDSKGEKWLAKLGEEAQPETVAVRLLLAVGYFAD